MQWGLDGARVGWILARLDPHSQSGAVTFFCANLKQVLEKSKSALVRVDMPIGLGTVTDPVRTWDVNARKILSGRLSSRVFTPPIYEVIECSSYAEANALSRKLIGKGLSVQSWNLVPKIRELDSFLNQRPRLQPLWQETHPEISFARLNDGQPIQESKKTESGARLRERLLQERAGVDFEKVWQALTIESVRGRFLKDDALDALALAASLE